VSTGNRQFKFYTVIAVKMGTHITNAGPIQASGPDKATELFFDDNRERLTLGTYHVRVVCESGLEFMYNVRLDK
jgi:hypothetical protein